jgi:hypothetical protein
LPSTNPTIKQNRSSKIHPTSPSPPPTSTTSENYPPNPPIYDKLSTSSRAISNPGCTRKKRKRFKNQQTFSAKPSPTSTALNLNFKKDSPKAIKCLKLTPPSTCDQTTTRSQPHRPTDPTITTNPNSGIQYNPKIIKKRPNNNEVNGGKKTKKLNQNTKRSSNNYNN